MPRLTADPDNAYALAALGGWNVEIVRVGRRIPGAAGSMTPVWSKGLTLFDRAVRAAPGNVAVRYQIALSLSGLDAETYRNRIESELQAAIQCHAGNRL